MSAFSSSDGPSRTYKIYFWIVLAAAVSVFLFVRGVNYAALPNIIGDLRAGPLAEVSELWSAGVRAAFGLCIFGSSVAIGHLIDRAISPESVQDRSHVLELGRKATVGAGIWLAAFVAASRLQFGSAAIAAIAAVATLPLLMFFVKRAREAGDESRVPEKASGADRILALILLGMICLAFLAAIVGGTFTGAAMFWAYPVLILSVFGWARESSLSRRSALIASVLVAAIPAICYFTRSEFRDVLFVLTGVLAVLSLLRMISMWSARWAVLLSIFIFAHTAGYFD